MTTDRLGEILAAEVVPRLPVNGTTNPRAVLSLCSDADRAKRWADWELLCRRIGRRYQDVDLETWEYSPDPEVASRQRSILARLEAFRSEIEARIAAGHGLVLFGPPGSGKDHLMVAMLRAAIRHGRSVRWENGLDLLGNLRDDIDTKRPESDRLKELLAPDVLAISDPVPPWGPLTQFQAAFLFRLIDRRYRDAKPIYVTGNFADGTDAADRLGTQLVDRLKDGALTLKCNWPSHRMAAK